MVRTSGSSAVSSSARTSGDSPWRANWLRSRPRAKMRELALLAQVGVPQVAAGIRSTAPRSGRPRLVVEIVEVGAEVARAARRSAGPIQVGPWTPLVMPRIGCSMTPCQVALAVSRVQLADGVRAVGQSERERRHVELARSPSTPRPSSSTRSTGTPPSSSSGPATRRTRSASNRSLPAETGVWIVKTLSRRTSARRPRAASRRRRTRAPARRGGTPSGPR